MRLVYRIVLHLAWVLSLLLAVWAVLFYFALTARIDREVDDALEVRAEVIIRQVLSGHAPASEGGRYERVQTLRGTGRLCRFAPADGISGRAGLYSRTGQ